MQYLIILYQSCIFLKKPFWIFCQKALYLFTIKFLFIACIPLYHEDEVYVDPCQGREEVHYRDPFYVYGTAFIQNLSTDCNATCEIAGIYDTTSFDSYFAHVRFRQNYYATSPTAQITNVQHNYVRCIPEGAVNVNYFESIIATTNFPIDSLHSAGDTINSILTIEKINQNATGSITFTVDWFMNSDSTIVDSEEYAFRINKAPALSDTFSININIRLHGEQEFHLTTIPIIFSN